MSAIADTEAAHCFAVIFTSQRTEDDRGYEHMADRMVELAREQPGFLGVESVRGEDGFGITVSYWESEEAIGDWKTQSEHRIAQETGKATWYADYCVRIAKVVRQYRKAEVK